MCKISDRSGVTIVEALLALLLLSFVIYAIVSLHSNLLGQTNVQLSERAAQEMFEAIELVVSSDDYCKGALGNDGGGRATFDLSTDHTVISGDNLAQINAGVTATSATTTTSTPIASELSATPGNNNGRVKVMELSIKALGAASVSIAGARPTKRSAAAIHVVLESVDTGKSYTRDIPTQIVSELNAGKERITTCYVQKFRFETLLGRLTAGTLTVSNTAGFGPQTDDLVDAAEIFKSKSTASGTDFALQIGCQESAGWKLVGCNRYDTATSVFANIVQIVNYSTGIACTTTGDPYVTLEATCMRVTP